VSDDTFTDTDTSVASAAAAAAAASDVSSESETGSVKKSNPQSSAALLTTEILDILQGYSGSLGPWLRFDCQLKRYSTLYCFCQKMLKAEKYKPEENILKLWSLLSLHFNSIALKVHV